MKKLIRVIFVFIVAMLWNNDVFAMQGEGCGAGECKDCHFLSVKEASQLLKGYVDKVTKTTASRVPGLWEVTVEKNKRKGVVLMDYSKSYIIDGRIIRFKEKIKLSFSQIPLDDSIIMGNPEARSKVVVFTDPDCQFCSKLHDELKKILKNEKNDIAFYIKLFPLRSIHPKAYDKAKVIACSSIPLTLLDHVYEGKNLVTDNVCDTTVIDKNLKLADTLGIKSTPTMVLEDGRMIRGYKDASSIVEFINSAEINKKEAKKEKKDETKKESKKEDSKN